MRIQMQVQWMNRIDCPADDDEDVEATKPSQKLIRLPRDRYRWLKRISLIPCIDFSSPDVTSGAVSPSHTTRQDCKACNIPKEDAEQERVSGATSIFFSHPDKINSQDAKARATISRQWESCITADITGPCIISDVMGPLTSMTVIPQRPVTALRRSCVPPVDVRKDMTAHFPVKTKRGRCDKATPVPSAGRAVKRQIMTFKIILVAKSPMNPSSASGCEGGMDAAEPPPFVRMWRYRQPGFALHLLHELQKQQRNGLQCDTLLQTEGVAVPAHSCVLSALSPIFSRAFTNSSSLPAGHSRLVNLQAVHPRALLKLVGFLYSGEMEGEGPGEQEEVIAIAHRLGFSHLIDGLKKLMNGQQDKAVRCREIGLQTEDTEREKKYADVQMLLRRESVTHTETQTDGPYAYFADACPVLESEPSLTRPDGLVSVSSEYATSSSAIGLHSKKDITSSSNVSKALNPVHSQCCQQIQVKNKRRKFPQNIGQVRKIYERQKLNVDEAQSDLLNSSVLERVKEVGGKDFRKLVEKLGFRSGSAFKQQEDTQISLKIKLKRRRKGSPWEIVSVQEESGADSSSASGRGHASPGQTQRHSEDGFTLAKPPRNCPEVLLSPSPIVPHQDLATVTLTPPSDLTMSPPATPAKNASEQSGLHNHETVPRSSHIQIPPASPVMFQAEESDEHIARILEDMVMMGLNILPSVPMDRNSSLHHQNEKHESPEPHLDPETGRCDTVDTASAPCFCLRGNNLGPGDPVVSKMPALTGSSAEGKAGPESPGCESQSKLETTELKNVATTARDPSLLGITSVCAKSQKDVDPSFLLPCTASEKGLLSSLPFGTGGIEMPHQNVAELKHVLDNLFWTADNFVQSVKQTKSETSEGRHWNLQTSGAATSSTVQDAPDGVSTSLQTASDTASSAAGKRCPEAVIWRDPKVLPDHLPRITHKVTGSANGIDLNELRLPRCLSPLVSEEGETDGFTQECLSQVTMSSSLSASSVTLKPALKYRISSRQPQSLPGKTGWQNQTNTHCHVTQKASSSSHSSELGSCSSRSVQDHMEETSEGILGQVMTQSLENQMFGESKDNEPDRQIGESEVKRISTKRHRVEAVISRANKKKCKMFDSDSEGIATQTVVIMTPSSGNGEAVEDISTTQLGNYPCSRKIYWLRDGSSVNHVSKDQKSMIKLTELQTNDSIKSKDQDKCTNDKDKTEPALSVAKRGRGRGRPPKKRNHVADFVQNLSKEKTLNSLSVDTRASTCAGKDEVLSEWSKTNSGCVQNEGHDLVKDKEQVVCLVAKRGRGRPTKGKKQALGRTQMVSNSNDFHEECASLTASTYAEHQDLQKAESKMTRGCEENKAQGPEMQNASIEFEEVIADMNLNKEEAKQPNVNARQAKKTSIVDQVFHQTSFSFGTSVAGHFAPIGQQRSASLLNTENSQKTKRKMITGPPLTEIIKKFRKLTERDHVRGRKLVIVNNEQEERESDGKGKMDSKNTNNDHLKMPSTNGNGLTENSETEMGTNQADKVSDIGITSKSHSYTVPLASNFGSNCDMVCDPQSTSTKVSESIELTLDRTEDFHYKETANTHIVHPEANQVWNNEKVKGNTEMVAVHMVEIPSKKDKPRGAEINYVEVEIMEESAPVAAGHREQAGTSAEKTDVEESLTNGESGTYEEEPGEPQFLRSDVEIMSSDEALTNTDSQAVTAKEALSVQLEEKPEQTDLSSTFSSKDLTAVISVGVNIENEAQDCDEDEEIVVDDLLSYPGILPHPSSARETITVLTEEEDELEEEEVDVTGEDTD
ncbi:hypothetical protein MHYP_G00035140 [Metynnis hypsauchen]